MTPNFSINDHANGRNRYAKFTGDSDLSFVLGVGQSNSDNFFLSKDAATVLGTFLTGTSFDDVVAMPLVILFCNILKIFKTAIVHYTVFMIDFLTIGTRTDEGKHDKAVDAETLSIQSNSWISMRAFIWFQRLVRQQRHYISRVGNYVKWVSRYWSPVFHGVDSITLQLNMVLYS